jgi:hypothetical protein
MFGGFVAELFGGGACHWTGHHLQHRTDGGSRRALHHRRARDSRGSEWARAQHHVGVFLLAAALVFTLPDRSGQALDA